MAAGDLLDGTVLLRFTPATGDPLARTPPAEGVSGVGTPFDAVSRELRDETDTFRRTPCFLRLSAPPLAFDADRLRVTLGV